MKKHKVTLQRIAVYSTLLGITLVTFMLPLGPQTSVAYMLPPDTLNLTGIVRDFSSTHPDFGITNAAVMGHYVGTVAPVLGVDRRPVSIGNGLKVATQWMDQYSNPIVPYATDAGLPGGHFDVDVYDAPVTSELYHEHEFDDTYDVTYVEVVKDPKMLFDFVIGPGYPNPLRVEFNNVHNGGGGTFQFHATGAPVTGITADGFTATFNPAQLKVLRVDFVALAALRQTQPGNSQDDAINRDDAFSIRMYDTVTNAMVYELAVYNHYKDENNNGILDSLENFVPVVQFDSCGTQLNDIPGVYSGTGTAGITDSTTFGQWFRDMLGTNQTTAHTISLQRDGLGVYDYMTTSFFPIDGRLLGNEGEPNNNLFTYTLSASFTYSACTGQFFEFESNDDAWAFVDSKLVIDLGGTLTPTRQYVDLDRLGLVAGQTYTIEFFFAHRRVDPASLFHMRTNMELVTSAVPSITAFYD